jgi:hypothetical protein
MAKKKQTTDPFKQSRSLLDTVLGRSEMKDKARKKQAKKKTKKK